MLTDCTTGPDCGGNNRARTCDPMLVRHVLSQLSYAPELSLKKCHASATVVIIHTHHHFVKHYFENFRNFFFIPLKRQKQRLKLLRRELIDVVAKLALDADGLILLHQLLKILFADCDQGLCDALTAAIAAIFDRRSL